MEIEKQRQGSLVGGIGLVAGTAIGGGMLALPVLSAAGGFLPAVVICFLCWIFMASTGILLMEVFLWKKTEINIVSMADMTLGRIGKAIAWLLYLYLFYSLMVAYTAGGGNLARIVIDLLGLTGQPAWLGPLLFVAVFAPFVAISAAAVGRINLILVFGLIGSFLIFVVLGAPHVDSSRLTNINWPAALLATPVFFTSFGFQGTVPTITNYLGRNPYRTRLAIWIGSGIPFLAYATWEWLILGVVPLDLLNNALKLGETAVYPLKDVLHLPALYIVGQFFAFFAIVTSFLGVAIGMLDFLADGLSMKKTLQNRVLLSALIFLPPLVFALYNTCLFIMALQFGGGFGCALLLGLIPILMAWRGRYKLGMKSEYQLPGGKVTLLLLIAFIVFELTIMVVNL